MLFSKRFRKHDILKEKLVCIYEKKNRSISFDNI